jgi:hypothetical protein
VPPSIETHTLAVPCPLPNFGCLSSISRSVSSSPSIQVLTSRLPIVSEFPPCHVPFALQLRDETGVHSIGHGLGFRVFTLLQEEHWIVEVLISFQLLCGHGNCCNSSIAEVPLFFSSVVYLFNCDLHLPKALDTSYRCLHLAFVALAAEVVTGGGVRLVIYMIDVTDIRKPCLSGT